MILYFTGTGNSRYIARKMADILGDVLVCMNEKIKQNDTQKIEVKDRLIFIFPTYAWRMPRIVEQWIKNTEFVGTEKTWFVMDCGGEIGNAAKYNKKLCEEKQFTYMGTTPIVMPENYIAMFNAPEEEEAKKVIQKADPNIDQAAHIIENGYTFAEPRNNLYDRFMSSVINPLFYPLFVKADAFFADDKCVGCGKCEKLCPMNNIKMTDKRPVWDKNCTHCMACICHCPTGAIEYGKKSVGKPRYHCD